MKQLVLQKATLALVAIAGIFLSVIISSCGIGGNCNSDSLVTSGSEITIDNAGVIPVFGNNPTSTIIYVHNNTKNTISGISYSSTTNSSEVSKILTNKLADWLQLNRTLVSIDGSKCSSINAGKSCPLVVVTPDLDNSGNSSFQGSMNIAARYSLNGRTIKFNQIINYAQVSNNQQPSGAKFQSSVAVSGYGNSIGYATMYLYASGQNQVYNVSSISINNSVLNIVNGNISGTQIKSNFVQAVEISSPIGASAISATITVNSNNVEALSSTDQFTNSASIVVEPVAAGAILTTGLIPLINTANSSSGSLFVQNSGSHNAVVGSVRAEAGISILSGCSGETLAPASSCVVNFNVTESGGSGNIVIPYTGGSTNSVVSNVTWFNGTGAMVSMYANNNPVTFYATTGNSTKVTVTNIGGYALSNVSITNPIVFSGSATAVLANDHCSNQALAINASCTYDVYVSDSVTDLNKQINLGFNASYAGIDGTQNYTQGMVLNYNSTAIPKYVYITNSGNNPSTISMYSINSGVLVPFSPESTVAAQRFSGSISFTPSGANAYVVNALGKNLSMFSVSDGLFTPLSPESTVATQLLPSGIVINQASTYAYVNNKSSASNSISIYNINAGGVLTPLTPESTVATQAGPMQVTFNKAGTYAYVVNQTSRTISMYSVDPFSGMLVPFSPESTVDTQTTPSLLTFNSAETYAYLTNLNSNTISMYSVNGNGLLTPLSPESTVATQSNPASFVLDSSNTHAYVVNTNSQSVSMYNIINGVLVPMTPESTVITQNTPNTIAFDKSGKHAYVINQISSTISMYNVNNSGVLMPMSPESTVATQGSPSGPMLIDPTNSFAYVDNYTSNTISMYRIIDGVLIPLSPESTVATQTGAVGLTFGPF